MTYDEALTWGIQFLKNAATNKSVRLKEYEAARLADVLSCLTGNQWRVKIVARHDAVYYQPEETKHPYNQGENRQVGGTI